MQAARKHYCINKSIIKKGNIDEGCDELLNSKYGCTFAQNLKRQGIGRLVSQVRMCSFEFVPPA